MLYVNSERPRALSADIVKAKTQARERRVVVEGRRERLRAERADPVATSRPLDALSAAVGAARPVLAAATAGRADFVGSGWAAALVVRWRAESSYVLCWARLG